MSDRAALGIGLGLWAMVAVAVLLPPVPDAWGGGIWLWLAAYGAVVLLLRVVWHRAPDLRARWASLSGRRRTALAVALAGGALGGLLAMREALPVFFGRLSRENGLWEPLSLTLYWGAALLLWRHVRALDPAARRPWLLVVGFFAFMGLEEIDWFGIFGGIFGHVEGVYAGSLHDLIRLVAEEVLGPVGIALAAAVGLLALVFLWRRGILDPALVGRLATGREVLWLVAGFGFLLVAAAEEAHLFGWIARDPTPEEAIELVGALCVAIWGLEVAAERLPLQTHL